MLGTSSTSRSGWILCELLGPQKQIAFFGVPDRAMRRLETLIGAFVSWVRRPVLTVKHNASDSKTVCTMLWQEGARNKLGGVQHYWLERVPCT